MSDNKIIASLKKVHWSVWLGLIIVLAVIRLCVLFSYRDGHHVDETWSYGYANSYYMLPLAADNYYVSLILLTNYSKNPVYFLQATDRFYIVIVTGGIFRRFIDTRLVYFCRFSGTALTEKL